MLKADYVKERGKEENDVPPSGRGAMPSREKPLIVRLRQTSQILRLNSFELADAVGVLVIAYYDGYPVFHDRGLVVNDWDIKTFEST